MMQVQIQPASAVQSSPGAGNRIGQEDPSVSLAVASLGRTCLCCYTHHSGLLFSSGREAAISRYRTVITPSWG